jgi:type II secretory pathway component PulK
MVNHQNTQNGYALLSALIAIALIAGAVAIRLQLQSVRHEASLIAHKQWVAIQYKKAEDSYRRHSNSDTNVLSIPVESLLEDRNSPTLKRHLRKKDIQ